MPQLLNKSEAKKKEVVESEQKFLSMIKTPDRYSKKEIRDAKKEVLTKRKESTDIGDEMRHLETTFTAAKIAQIKENEKKAQFEEFKQQYRQASPKVQAMFVEKILSSKVPGFSEELQDFAIQECSKSKDGVKELEKIFVRGNDEVKEVIASRVVPNARGLSEPIGRYCYEQGPRWME